MTRPRHPLRPQQELDEFFPHLVASPPPVTPSRWGPGLVRMVTTLLAATGVLSVSVLLGRLRG